jgi:hypothetical protein
LCHLFSFPPQTETSKGSNKKRPQSSKSLCPLVIANTSEASLYDNISAQIVQLENNIFYGYSHALISRRREYSIKTTVLPSGKKAGELSVFWKDLFYFCYTY